MVILARKGSLYEQDTFELVARVVPRNAGPVDTVLLIDWFLRSSFIYRDERDEVLREVSFMLNDLQTMGHMEGDCDDMAIMGAAMVCASGIPTRFTAIKSSNPDEFDHVFVEARLGVDWVPVDPTVPYGTIYQQFGFVSEVVC